MKSPQPVNRSKARTWAVVGGVLAAAAIIGAGPVLAQQAAGTAPPESPTKYKMTTPIPASIPMPDKVETRFGTLNFFDGFPDQASTEKLFDNLDFQRAVQAYFSACLR